MNNGSKIRAPRLARAIPLMATMAACLVLWCLPGDLHAQSAKAWAGTWYTSWDEDPDLYTLKLTQKGNLVEGTYNYMKGRVSGTVKGQVFSGTWSQSDGDGWFAFTLAADGKSFSGTWGAIGSKQASGMWWGSRDKDIRLDTLDDGPSKAPGKAVPDLPDNPDDSSPTKLPSLPAVPLPGNTPDQAPAGPVAAGAATGGLEAAYDTARKAGWLTEQEKLVMYYMNWARMKPAEFAEKFLAQRRSEGAYADECYRELKAKAPTQALQASRGLWLAAKSHADDQGPSGQTGHNGTRGSTMTSRIEAQGEWDRTIGENISYGYDQALDIVLQLLIDDGVSSRGHRKNIMNPEFRVAGAAIGRHSGYRFMCVQDFAGGFTDK